MDNGREPRLGDLFILGTHDPDGPTKGEPITFESKRGSVAVHVVMVNDNDAEAIERRALAAKSIRLAMLLDREGSGWHAHYLSVLRVSDRDELIGFLVADRMKKPRIEIEAKLRTTGKWGKDDYYDNLLEAWYGNPLTGDLGLMYLWQQRPEQSEDPVEQAENDERVAAADTVWAELEAYQAELAEQLEDHRDMLRDEYGDEPVDEAEAANDLTELRDKVVEVMVNMDADTHFYEEQQRQQVFYATRQVDNWRKRYFETLDEVTSLPRGVRNEILKVYGQLTVEGVAGKDSPATPDSLPPSASSDAAEGSPASGPEAASPSKTSLTSS